MPFLFKAFGFYRREEPNRVAGVLPFAIDKAGDDLYNQNYSIVVVKNQQAVFGCNIPQLTKDLLKKEFNDGTLNIGNKTNFKIRFHTSIVISLMKEAIKGRYNLNPCQILVCNDIDGHLHEIKDMLMSNLKIEMPTLEKENVIGAKFSKNSLVNIAAKAFFKNNKPANYSSYNFDIECLRKIIGKKKVR